MALPISGVATLFEPPGSTYDEATWIAEVLAASGCNLLLDLHNLYANASNCGFEAREFLARLPVERIAAMHLAGGQWLPGRRLLDDHCHDVPEPVYELLTEVGGRAPQALTVILERDGQYPPMAHLLAQLARAREALASGRQRRTAEPHPHPSPPPAQGEGVSPYRHTDRLLDRCFSGCSPALETFLAQIYADAQVRERFLADPLGIATTAGLTASEVQAVQHIDRAGLALAASSFARKRHQRQRPRRWCFTASLYGGKTPAD